MEKQFREQFVQQSLGPVLVVGSRIYKTRPDWREWHPDGIGVDMVAGPGVHVVADLEAGPLHNSQKCFGHIECCSVLEHTKRPWLVAQNLSYMLRDAGTMFVSVPWIWRYHSYPGDLWRFSHEALAVLFPTILWIDVKYVTANGFADTPRSAKTDDGNLEKTMLMAWGRQCG